MLAAVVAAVFVSLAMKNIRLEAPPAAAPADLPAPDHDVAPVRQARRSLPSDRARSARDEALAGLLASANGVTGPAERKRAAAGLLSLANRIEYGDGDYPNLVRAAASLANGHDGDERERAVCASKTIIRPLREKLRTER